MLDMLKKADPTNELYVSAFLSRHKRSKNADKPLHHSKCITLVKQFEHVGHVCFATPLLGPSVFDFLKENQYSPFPYSHVQSFARQLLTSVGCTSLTLFP